MKSTVWRPLSPQRGVYPRKAMDDAQEGQVSGMQQDVAFSPTGVSVRGLTAWIILTAALFCLGCGGGGGSAEKASEGNLELIVVPVKISREGTGDREGIFASVKGSGVSGGRLEDPQFKPIANSDLRSENATGRYEILLEGAQGQYVPGEYTLKYYVNGETKDYKSKSLEWATIQVFRSTPNLTWDESSRNLTVSAPDLPGSARYLLELYESGSGFLVRQTQEFISAAAVSEIVPNTGAFRVGFVGNTYESGALKSKTIFFFAREI